MSSGSSVVNVPVSFVSFVVVAALFLEQILKRRPRIIRPQSRRSRSLLLPGHPNLIKRALIPRILLRNPLLHRLHALEPAPRIEIRALFARMQLKPALRTLPIARHSLQHRPALRAARNRPRPRQIDGLRPKREIPLRRSPAPRFLSRPLARLFTVAILIAMLPIFCCHKPSHARAYCLPKLPRAASARNIPSSTSVSTPTTVPEGPLTIARQFHWRVDGKQRIRVPQGRLKPSPQH